MSYEKRLNDFSAIAGEMAMCPYPECGHMGDMITKAHCKIKHNMTREELFKKHGKPFRVITNRGKMIYG